LRSDNGTTYSENSLEPLYSGANQILTVAREPFDVERFVVEASRQLDCAPDDLSIALVAARADPFAVDPAGVFDFQASGGIG
jgi:hypothetical protein